LLGAAASGKVVSPKDDPRRVVIVKMRVMFEDRPDGHIEYDLDTKEKLDAMKDKPFVLMEGCKYKIEVTFRVQHDIVSGLKYTNAVYRKGVRVDKQATMLGSFGPQGDAHVVVFPRHGWDEAPSGMLARGDYKAKSSFSDDDGVEHLSYEYTFGIKKGWTEK
jgi:Rho GDP-dissociation inhibitor